MAPGGALQPGILGASDVAVQASGRVLAVMSSDRVVTAQQNGS